MLDIIKEYLVGIGCKVDANSFADGEKAINSTSKTITRFASSLNTDFIKATTVLTGFFAACEVGFAKYLGGLAQADLENEKFARRMWMSKDTATAYNNSMKALGVTLQDLYLSPELLEKYVALQKQALSMRPPTEYNSQMKEIRSVVFEFQRMKLEATYAMQWIGYYVFKYLQKPIEDFKKSIKGLNDRIVKDMPSWTKEVAQVISWFVRLGTTAGKAGKDLIKIFQSLPTQTKVAGGALAGLFALIKMGPIGWLITGLTTILLLLDDFNTYKSGGESLFEGLWKQLEAKEGLFSDKGPFGMMKGAISSVGDVISSVEKALDSLFKKMENASIPQKFAEALGMLVGSFAELAGTIWAVLNQLAQLAGYKDFGDLITTNIVDVIDRASNAIKGFAKLLDVLNRELKGDFEGAWKSMKDEWDYFGKAILGDKSTEDTLKSGNDKNGSNFTDPQSFIDSFMKGFRENYNNDNNQNTILNNYLKGIGSSDNGLATNQSYIYPRTDVRNNYSPNINNNYNIYGSEPYSTAKAVQRTQITNDDLLIRAFQGRYI